MTFYINKIIFLYNYKAPLMDTLIKLFEMHNTQIILLLLSIMT